MAEGFRVRWGAPDRGQEARARAHRLGKRHQRHARGVHALVVLHQNVDKVLGGDLEVGDFRARHRARHVEHERHLEVLVEPAIGERRLGANGDCNFAHPEDAKEIGRHRSRRLEVNGLGGGVHLVARQRNIRVATHLRLEVGRGLGLGLGDITVHLIAAPGGECRRVESALNLRARRQAVAEIEPCADGDHQRNEHERKQHGHIATTRRTK